jgi:hypothetical protein
VLEKIHYFFFVLSFSLKFGFEIGSVAQNYCLEAKSASCFRISSATIESIADSIPLLEWRLL